MSIAPEKPTPAQAAQIAQRLSIDLDWVRRRTDKMFAIIMPAQWLLALIFSLVVAPRRWAGVESRVSPHVIAAIVLGGILTSLPVFLAVRMPGRQLTRHVVAVAQMCMGALLIHLTGGRIETHFHVFGSLAFLAFYLDEKVLITATVVVVLDHSIRGFVWPQSVYGTIADSQLRFLEHAAWVVFEIAGLLITVRAAIADKRRAVTEVIAREQVLASVEQQVLDRTEELAQSESVFRTLNERAPIGIVLMGHDGQVLNINACAKEMLLVQTTADGKVAWQQAREAMGLQIADRLWQRIAAGETFLEEFTMTHGQKEPRWIRLQCTPLPAQQGIPVSMLIYSDRTDEKQREAAMRAAAEAAEAGNRAKSQFLAAMSHDLRTPLNAILGHAELLLDAAKDRNNAQEILDVSNLMAGGRRLLRLISDLLDVARMEAGQAGLRLESFELEALVREVAVCVGPQLDESSARLNVDVANGIATCVTDRTKLRRVLTNLLTTCARVSTGGAIDLRAGTKRTETGEDRLQIQVIGDEIGIDSSRFARLLDPSAEPIDSVQRKGTLMMGFAISQQLCRLLGGDLTVGNATDARTAFLVDVPLKLAQDAVLDPDLPETE